MVVASARKLAPGSDDKGIRYTKLRWYRVAGFDSFSGGSMKRSPEEAWESVRNLYLSDEAFAKACETECFALYAGSTRRAINAACIWHDKVRVGRGYYWRINSDEEYGKAFEG